MASNRDKLKQNLNVWTTLMMGVGWSEDFSFKNTWPRCSMLERIPALTKEPNSILWLEVITIERI